MSAQERQVPRVALTTQEAAEALGISVQHFRKHVQPHVPVVYSGQLRLYPLRGLEDWAERVSAVPGGR